VSPRDTLIDRREWDNLAWKGSDGPGRVAPEFAFWEVRHRVNEVLKQILETGTVTDGRVSVPVHSNVSKAEGQFLAEVIASTRPKSSIEIGMAFGISTLFLCEALAALSVPGTHIVIDPHQHRAWKGIGLRNLREAGYEHMVRFIEAPSEIALPQLLQEGLRIDFAFVDGLHRFDQVLLEFYYLNRLLSVGGVLVFDDTDYPGEIGRASCRERV